MSQKPERHEFTVSNLWKKGYYYPLYGALCGALIGLVLNALPTDLPAAVTFPLTIVAGIITGVLGASTKQLKSYSEVAEQFIRITSTGRTVLVNSNLDVHSSVTLEKIALALAESGSAAKQQVATNTLEHLLDGLKAGQVSLAVDDFADVCSLIESITPQNAQVYATCFTSMDRFWCHETIGPQFYRMNYNIVNNKSARVHRLIGVDGDRWKSTEIKKREVVDLLASSGMTPRLLDCSEISASNLPDDMFVAVDQGGRFAYAIQWDVTEDGTPARVTIHFPSAHDKATPLLGEFRRIESEHADKLLTWDKSDAASLAGDTIVTLEAGEAVLRTLSSARIGSNSTQYLRHPALRNIDAYWRGLEGTIVRPSAATVEESRALIATASPKTIAIMGSTPEVRVAAIEGGAETVDCIDLSSDMYNAMTQLVQDVLSAGTSPRSPSNGDLHRRNWLSMHTCEHLLARYDLIIGVDITNMVPHESLALLFDSMARLLHPDGRVFLQYIVIDARDKRLQRFLDDALPVGNRRAQDLFNAATKLGISNHHDIFFYSAIAYSGASIVNGELKLPARTIVDLPSTFDRFNEYHAGELPPEFNAFLDEVLKAYKHCHSKLAISRRSTLVEQARAHGLVAIPTKSEPRGRETSAAAAGSNLAMHMHTLQLKRS